jgi:cytochrome c biogenesis protein CcmG/thiol:disulfide interchange protein DsbE
MDRRTRERNQPATTVSPVRTRRTAGTRAPATSGNGQRTAPAVPARRRRRKPPVQLTVQPVEARIAALVAVAVLVFVAIWLDRGTFDPAPGSGLVPQPGSTTLVVPGSALAEGDSAPNFVLRTPDNEPIELASQRGEVVVLHFGATWCLECRAEVPALNGIDGQDGVSVFGIAVGDEPSRVATAADDFDVTYTMLVDPDGEVASAYGATSFPVTVVVGPDGVVAGIFTGPFDPATLQEAVDAARG